MKIIGGKHFKTPDGEFVEMKSGTQYKIHVKNSHTYGCHVDISIDGYDVGGWALRRGEEMSIERSVHLLSSENCTKRGRNCVWAA